MTTYIQSFIQKPQYNFCVTKSPKPIDTSFRIHRKATHPQICEAEKREYHFITFCLIKQMTIKDFTIIAD